MAWADYREKAKKAKVHIGFNINQSIPSKIYLTHGKGDERPFVERIVTKGQIRCCRPILPYAIRTLITG
jgi:hypothetical protein